MQRNHALYYTPDIGWQSWMGVSTDPLLKIPKRNFNPHAQNDISFPTATKPPRTRPVTGWCSWYAYGKNISEEKILTHADFISRNDLSATTILIDDGWQTHTGDWTPDTHKFPRGLGPVATDIRAKKLTAGLWIAPFLVHPKSTLANTHTDWLIRGQNTHPINGRNVSLFDRLLPQYWVLNLEKKEVRQYIHTVIKTIVATWGFTYLKLDFLDAQHFNPWYVSNTVPDSLLHDFLSRIKRTYPHVFLSASGCPLRPAVGCVDAMRISEDIVAPQLCFMWPLNHLLHSIRLKQLTANLTRREALKKYWLLDPDVFVCHRRYGFSTTQIQHLYTCIKTKRFTIFRGQSSPTRCYLPNHAS